MRKELVVIGIMLVLGAVVSAAYTENTVIQWKKAVTTGNWNVADNWIEGVVPDGTYDAGE
jgi:hypothetical protein